MYKDAQEEVSVEVKVKAPQSCLTPGDPCTILVSGGPSNS